MEQLLSEIEKWLQALGQLGAIYDRILTTEYMVIGVLVLLGILLISNFSQSSKIDSLIQKVNELEGKINERDIPRVKRNNGERS